ncbi:MAG: tRNA (adenine-N1)-methyltransferase [Parascardovia denticolens]
MAVVRGPFQAGEKVQFTDRKMNKVTFQLVPGGSTQTEHGHILHDQVIGRSEGTIVNTVPSPHGQEGSGRRMGGWTYCAMRPRLADYVLSMPRGAQIMYPKDIAQVIQLGDIRPGMEVLESGGGSGAMSLNLLEAVGEGGRLITIELREDFARICRANAQLFYGHQPDWWIMVVGDFDRKAEEWEDDSFDRIVLDMLDPWNRLDQAYRLIRPGGVLVSYVTTTTQLSRLSETLRESGHWTEPDISESLERTWKADGLAVRPNHQMIGHTGFLVVTRAMAPGFAALFKRDRPSKDTHADIDLKDDMEKLQLRDISDRKTRKVLRDLDLQTSRLNSGS